MVSKPGLMGRNILETGTRTSNTATEDSGIKMVRSMMVTGRMAWLQEKAFIQVPMVRNSMMALGIMISNMERGLSPGKMEVCIRVNTITQRNRERGFMFGLTRTSTLESGLIMRFTETEFIFGLMDESTVGSGNIIRCTGRELTSGMMEGSTMGCTSSRRRMGTEFTFMLMEEHALETGLMEYKTQKDLSFYQMEKLERVFGRIKTRRSGLTSLKRKNPKSRKSWKQLPRSQMRLRN